MAKAKVLLVEDDPIQARETEEILKKTGYEVFWAQDGINAIKVVKSSKPDIILLDLILPGLDGYEVCRWLKLDDSAKGIPVIMLTVKKDLSDKISGLQIGADDYLPKPYNELELNARIYASLRTKGLQDELRMKNRQLEELLDKVNYMAITDALTGLYNRRKFHDTLAGEFERARRYKTPFSLVMIDIDHFKRINDDHGHNAGDVVLKQVSALLLKSVREIDTASRFGGEEFMVILPSTDSSSAKVVAERMRDMIASFPFQDINRPITVSIGIAGMPDERLRNEDLMIRCADIALYRAKQSGRNRVEVASGADLDRTS
ncbi:MAG: diguanylate cyclase [Nitrospiraceae bacterium]|nr:diguanylate cyclase [Nitrospiraceae bacterium]